MIFRGRWQKLGCHVHMRVFCAKAPSLTFAGLGELIMTEEDFKCFQQSSLDAPKFLHGWEFIDETRKDVIGTIPVHVVPAEDTDA